MAEPQHGMHGNLLPEAHAAPWENTYRSWRGRLGEAGCNAILQLASPHDVLLPQDEPLTEWHIKHHTPATFVPRGSAAKYEESTHAQWSARKSVMLYSIPQHGSGVSSTADLLAHAKGDQEKVAAVLIGAALWSGINSRRPARWAANGATHIIADNIFWGVREFIIRAFGVDPWYYPMGTALPNEPGLPEIHLDAKYEDLAVSRCIGIVRCAIAVTLAEYEVFHII